MTIGLAVTLLLAMQEERAAVARFDLVEGAVVVKGCVGAAERLALVVDTGRAGTALTAGAAERAGLRKGGRARVEVAGAEVADLPVAVSELARDADGVLGTDYLKHFRVAVDFEARTLTLTRPAGGVTAGFSYRTIGDDEANEIGVEGGVVVQAVAAGGPAEKAGLKAGDIIQEIGERRIDTADDYAKVLARSSPGDVLKIVVIRGKKDVTVELRLEARKR